MTKRLLFKTTILIATLTVILFYIFKNASSNGSVLLNNLLWFRPLLYSSIDNK